MAILSTSRSFAGYQMSSAYETSIAAPFRASLASSSALAIWSRNKKWKFLRATAPESEPGGPGGLSRLLLR